MIEIVIVKSASGINLNDTHNNSLFFSGNVAYDAVAMRTLAQKIADLEAHFSPTTTRFLRAIIREVKPNGKAIKGHSRSIPLNISGQYAVPVGQKLAPANQVIAFEKSAGGPRPGVTKYRHVLTNEEVRAYNTDGTVPARFSDTAGYPDAPAVQKNFVTRLKELGQTEGMALVVPDNNAADNAAARVVSEILFGGVRTDQSTRNKKPVKSKQVQLAQQQINEIGRQVEALKDGSALSALDAAQRNAFIVELKLKASNILAALDLELRLKIEWPESLKNA